MSRELIQQLLATPTLQLANVSIGDRTRFSATVQTDVSYLTSLDLRRTWSRRGFALSNGSFPAPNLLWLRQSLSAWPLAANKPQAKRFLTRRAYALNRPDVLPVSWRNEDRDEIVIASALQDPTQGVMLAVYPPSDMAQVLAGSAEDDHAPNDLHVTVLYFGNLDEIDIDALPLLADAVRDVAATAPHFTARVNDVSQFVANDGVNPQIYEVECEGLADLRDQLITAAENVGLSPRLEFDFHPHMTVRYGGDMLSAVPEGGDAEWPVDHIVLSAGEEDQAFPLGETAEADQTEGDEMATKTSVVGGGPGSGPQAHTESDAKSAGAGGNASAPQTGIADPKTPPTASPSTTTPATAPHGPGQSGAGGRNPEKVKAKKPRKRPGTAAPAAGGAVPAGPVIKTPGANASWSEEFSYFWDREGDEIFRVNTDGLVEAYDTDGDQPTWTESECTVDDALLLPAVTTSETLAVLTAAAEGNVGENGADSGDETSEALPSEAGRKFRIPMVIPEGIPSGDRRSFSQGGTEFKDPPIPLLWQKTTAEGHDGSVTVGKITSLQRLEGGLGNAEGVFDTHEDAIEAARQVKEKFLTGVSGDVDQFEYEVTEIPDEDPEMNITHGRLVAATLVAKPAFQECTIEFVNDDEEAPVILASAGPLHPPREWFVNPRLTQATHLDVTDDGRVFGHIAEWGTPHLGNPQLTPPRSLTNYREFNSRPVRTADGADVRTGQLTLAGGHAGIDLAPDRVVAHYDDTRSAVADVVAGEDEFGIWVAGAMRPDITDHQVRAFRASDPSGDWRRIQGNLELVAVCQVNTPGFPVARSLVASGGIITALVAAGTAGLVPGEKRGDLAAMIAALSTRVNELENIESSRKRELAVRRIGALKK